MKRITLVCAGGMSTCLLVNKMNEAAKELGVEVEIRAIAEGKFKKYETETDIVLIGPQIAFLLKKYKEKYEATGMVVGVIDCIDYGTMNGEKVLKEALGI